MTDHHTPPAAPPHSPPRCATSLPLLHGSPPAPLSTPMATHPTPPTTAGHPHFSSTICHPLLKITFQRGGANRAERRGGGTLWSNQMLNVMAWNRKEIAIKQFTFLLQRNIHGAGTSGCCCESIINTLELPGGCGKASCTCLQWNFTILQWNKIQDLGFKFKLCTNEI